MHEKKMHFKNLPVFLKEKTSVTISAGRFCWSSVSVCARAGGPLRRILGHTRHIHRRDGGRL